MSLPDWVGDKGHTLAYDVADSFYTAPGYRVLGDDFYTCVEPVDRHSDRVVIACVRSFCPEVIPIWRKQRYMPPNSTEAITVTHFGIAIYNKDPKHELHIKYVEMPANADHPMPNQLEFILENRQDKCVMEDGGPAPYVPVDMRLYRYLREDYTRGRAAKQIADIKMAEFKEKREREIAFLREEQEYRMRDINRYIQKQLDAPGDTVAAYHQWVLKSRWLGMRKRRKMGTAKPMIHV